MTILSSVILEGLNSALPSAGIPGRIYFATDTAQVWYDNGTSWVNVLSSSGRAANLGVVIDGGGTVPTTGAKGFVQVPFACTITGWTLLADQSGSAQITVSKCSYASYPTAASIDASAPPALVSAIKNTSTTLTGWTTSLSAGDILLFNLDSVATVNKLILQLTVQ